MEVPRPEPPSWLRPHSAPSPRTKRHPFAHAEADTRARSASARSTPASRRASSVTRGLEARSSPSPAPPASPVTVAAKHLLTLSGLKSHAWHAALPDEMIVVMAQASKLSAGGFAVSSGRRRILVERLASDCVSLLMAHSSDGVVQAAGLDALLKLTEVHVGAVVSSGGVVAAATAMAAHPQQEDVQRRCCQLAGLRACAKAFLIAEGLPLVVQAMQAHSMSVRHQRAACGVLTALGQEEPKAAELLTSSTVLTAVARAMEVHTHDAALQRSACRALTSLLACGSAGWDHHRGSSAPALSVGEQGALAAARSGALAATVGAMRRHESDGPLQEVACQALVQMASGGAKSRLAVVAAGGAVVAVAAISRHAGNAAVGRAGCRAIACIARGRAALLSEPDVAGKHAVIDAGAPSTLVGVMGIALGEASQALLSLAFGKNAQRDAVLSVPGVCSAIVAAMTAHVQDDQLQSDCCGALRLFSNASGASARLVASAGGVAAVIAAMSNHPDNDDVQVDATRVLWNTAASGAEQKRSLMALGGIRAMLNGREGAAGWKRVLALGETDDVLDDRELQRRFGTGRWERMPDDRRLGQSVA